MGFTELASHEATREQSQNELLKLSVRGLETSVQGFEVTHPNLVKVVNDLCVLLSSIGI